MRWFINSITNDDFEELPIVLDRLKKWILRPTGLFIGDIIYMPVQRGFARRKITKKFYNWKEGVWFVSLDDNGTPMDIPYEFAIEIRQRYYTRKITETIGTYINNMNDKLNNLKD
jgi:hypothetical protein